MSNESTNYAFVYHDGHETEKDKIEQFKQDNCFGIVLRIQEAMTCHESTKDPERGEYPKIYETLMRHISSKFGVFVEWPTKETKERDKAA